MPRTKRSGAPKNFTMKKVPQKPKRTIHKHDINITGIGGLKSLVKYAKNNGIDPDRIKFAKPRYSYYGDIGRIYYEQPESEDSYNKKLVKWQEKMDEYNKWREENKESIEAYERAKKLEAVEKLEKKKATAEKKHKKAMETQRKEMDVVEKLDDEIYEKKKSLGLI